jgi:hypothetical protein
MKALISPNEIVSISYVTNWELIETDYHPVCETITDCVRIAEVVQDDNEFEVAHPLHWIECPSDCTPNTYYYKNNVFIKIPEEPVKPSLSV